MTQFLAGVLLWVCGFAFATAMWLHPLARRYVLWTARCWRGRRCANVVFGGVTESSTAMPSPGSLAVFNYTCGGCGTPYRLSAVFGEDGSYVESGRRRVHSNEPPPHPEVEEHA